MSLHNKIIKEYPLAKRIPCNLICYYLENKRYLVIWDSLITKASIGEILSCLQSEAQNPIFSKWKTLIVVGKTNDSFKKKELVYFDSISTFVVFLLLNEDTKDVYMDDSWIYALGCNYRKHVRKISESIKSLE